MRNDLLPLSKKKKVESKKTQKNCFTGKYRRIHAYIRDSVFPHATTQHTTTRASRIPAAILLFATLARSFILFFFSSPARRLIYSPRAKTHTLSSCKCKYTTKQKLQKKKKNFCFIHVTKKYMHIYDIFRISYNIESRSVYTNKRSYIYIYSIQRERIV